MRPRIRMIVAGLIGVLSVVGYVLVPNGQPITIDNRGYLGPFDVAQAPTAMYRVWLRLLILGAGVVLALLILGIAKTCGRGAFRGAALAALLFTAAAALAYPKGPPDPPPVPCLPGGSLGPRAAPCRIYYSDHQPGPTYPGIRAAFLASGIGVAAWIIARDRRARTRFSVPSE